MAMRLIRQQDRERQGIGFNQIESPFFAKSIVREALLGRRDELFGLDDFLRAHGRTRDQLWDPHWRRVLASVEEGDWLLVTDNPFSPLSKDTTGIYPRIIGLRRQVGSQYYPLATLAVPATQRKPSLPKSEPAAPTARTDNDRVNTREVIIRLVRGSGGEFVERSSWGAHRAKADLIDGCDYSMIALHHAGRSMGCGFGAGQMRAIQSEHQAKFDDIGYHYGIDCMGKIFEGRDIRFKGSSVHNYNTGVIGIVLLENLTTAEEGGDMVAFARQTLETMKGNMDQKIPAVQIDSLLNLVQALTRVFRVTILGGHREFPGQAGEGKICPGNIGMTLVRNLCIKTQLLPPPSL